MSSSYLRDWPCDSFSVWECFHLSPERVKPLAKLSYEGTGWVANASYIEYAMQDYSHFILYSSQVAADGSRVGTFVWTIIRPSCGSQSSWQGLVVAMGRTSLGALSEMTRRSEIVRSADTKHPSGIFLCLDPLAIAARQFSSNVLQCTSMYFNPRWTPSVRRYVYRGTPAIIRRRDVTVHFLAKVLFNG